MVSPVFIFNIAVVLVLLALFVALGDLLRHKARTYGVTLAPTSVPLLTTPATSTTTLATTAPRAA